VVIQVETANRGELLYQFIRHYLWRWRRCTDAMTEFMQRPVRKFWASLMHTLLVEPTVRANIAHQV
jgi:hypothetical protein